MTGPHCGDLEPPDARAADAATPFGAEGAGTSGTSAIREAFETLPPPSQDVLRLLDVEGRTPGELAELLELPASAVPALVYRARSTLRDAYLGREVAPPSHAARPTCQEIRELLPGLLGRTLPSRAQQRVHAHLQGCAECLSRHLRQHPTGTIGDESAHTG